jgi:hypothetical protein
VRTRAIRALWFCLIGIVILSLLTNELVHIIDERRIRYLIAAWPLLALVAAVGLARIQRPLWLGLLILALWAGLGVWHSLNASITPLVDGYTYLFPMQRVAAALRGEVQPDDVIVTYVPDTGLDSDYYEHMAAFYLSPLPLDYLMAQGNAGGILEIAVTRPRIYVAYAPEYRPAQLGSFIEALRATHSDCGAAVQREDLHIELYALPGLCGSD